MRERIRRFMIGRYGTDALSQFLVYASLVCIILSIFIKSNVWTVLVLAMLIFAYYRILSKNHQKRYEENQKYLALQGKVTAWFQKEKYLMDQRKDFHIYKCPDCKQKIRIPKGKGKIVITCPKCHREFTKKS